jgi:hypothetical protein
MGSLRLLASLSNSSPHHTPAPTYTTPPQTCSKIPGAAFSFDLTLVVEGSVRSAEEGRPLEMAALLDGIEV